MGNYIMNILEKRWGKLKLVEGKTFDRNSSWDPQMHHHYKNCTFDNLRLKDFNFSNFVLENCTFQNCIFQEFIWTESDLIKTKFVSCIISFGYFGDILLKNVEFKNCWDIHEFYLGGCEINGATFNNCDFSHSRIESIIGKGRIHLKFKKTKLNYCFFQNVDLTKSTVESCDLIYTTFSNCMLKKSTVAGNNQSPNESYCSIDLQSLQLSENLDANVLKNNFGINNSEIKDYVMGLTAKITFQSVFISYSFSDKIFANRLNECLKRNGVFTFLFEKDSPGGKRLKEIMTDGVNDHDRLLFIASENSLKSPACQYELTQGRIKQEQTWNTIFYPIHIDNYLFEVKKYSIKPNRKQKEYWENIEELKEVNSLDFSEFNKTDFNKTQFENKVCILIKELRKEKEVPNNQ